MCKKKKLRSILPFLTAAAIVTSSLPFSSVFAANTSASESGILGDVNNDGQVNLVDAMVLKSHILGKDVYINPSASDINGDRKINAIDYLLLKKMLINGPENADTKVVKANNDFAFDIFKAVNKGDADNNVFISPLSISTALSMVYEGAGSSTKEEMTNALRYKGLDINTINQGYKSLLSYLNNADPKVKLSVNNSIWYRDGFKVNDSFINTNKDVFDSYVSPLNFADPKAADTINSWISNSTNKMIPSMINPPIPDDIVMYLINAIYFKGQWSNVFDGRLSDYGYFKNGKAENKQVVYMKKEHVALDFAEGSDYKAVRLPYGSGSTAMYCILPDSSIPVNDFISNLNADKWNSIKQSIKKTEDVKLLLPRFKIGYGTVSLNDSLKSLGINSAFTGKADFSGIAPNIFISDVKHKAVVEVNENGTEAAAVTVVVGNAGSAMPKPTPEFIADRPFVFVIADEKKGSILFLGKAFDLEEKKPAPEDVVSIGDQNNGSTILLDKGKTLKLGLEENASTGYMWNYSSPLNETVLSKGKEYYVTPYIDVPGAPSTRYWEYRAISSGTATIDLKYIRPWAADEPIKTYKVTVIVKGNAIEIDEKNNGSTISLQPGQTLRLALSGQSGTAYIWQYSTTPDKNVLSSTNEYSQTLGNNPGAPYMHYWEYKAVTPGVTSINLKFAATGTEQPLYTFNANIIVK